MILLKRNNLNISNKDKEDTCEYCNKIIYLTNWDIEHRKHHFCSQPCYWNWKKGRNEHCWSKGLTKETSEKIVNATIKSKQTLLKRYGSTSSLSALGAKEKMIKSRRETDNYGKGQSAKGRIYKSLTEGQKEKCRESTTRLWKNSDFRKKNIEGRGIRRKEVVDFCKQCEEKILSHPNQPRKFCSADCYSKFIKGKSYEEKFSKEKAKKIKEKISRIKTGHEVSEDTRKKISGARKPYIVSKKTRKKLSEAWKRNPERKRELRSRNINDNPAKYRKYLDTNIEKILQDKLDELDIKYTTNKTDIYGWPDIFIEPNICIFADGCYWHCCKIHSITNKYSSKRIKRDNKVSNKLKEENYKVLRFWEHDIHNNLDECINKIMEEIKNGC